MVGGPPFVSGMMSTSALTFELRVLGSHSPTSMSPILLNAWTGLAQLSHYQQEWNLAKLRNRAKRTSHLGLDRVVPLRKGFMAVESEGRDLLAGGLEAVRVLVAIDRR